MTRFLTIAEVLELYARVVAIGGGAFAIRDLGALESAIAQPRATFEGAELYQTLEEKAAALGFSLILNHPLSMATSESDMPRWKSSSC